MNRLEFPLSGEVFVSILALLVSVASIVFSFYNYWQGSKLTGVTQGNQAIIEVERMLKDVPSALEFHGITVEELEQAGVSVDEFVYLLTSFTAGGVYYRSLPTEDDSGFPEGSYRHVMCSQKKTRSAWPYVRKMLGDHVFRRKLDATFEAIERIEKVLESTR